MIWRLGAVRKALILVHAALKTASECSCTPVQSGATPAVPRLFSPCLTRVSRLFVQRLAPGSTLRHQGRTLHGKRHLAVQCIARSQATQLDLGRLPPHGAQTAGWKNGDRSQERRHQVLGHRPGRSHGFAAGHFPAWSAGAGDGLGRQAVLPLRAPGADHGGGRQHIARANPWLLDQGCMAGRRGVIQGQSQPLAVTEAEYLPDHPHRQ